MEVQWSYISSAISDQLGYPLILNNPQSIGGGCINQTWKVSDQHQQSWFIKLNKPSRQSMFDAELGGLEAIKASQSIRAPMPLCSGASQQYSFLIMEYIDLKGTPDAATTGQKIANMHQHTQSTYGWHSDNTIGSTPQINTLTNSWVDFWKEHRLLFQLELALNKGLPHHTYESGLTLIDLVDQFFTIYQPIASLLHGDLWGGNCSGDTNGQPVIYDPAVYFGDRETDLAMTELFGGFSSHFKESYHDSFPIDEGYGTRKTLYNLYHILNHFNLFGGSYGNQANNMINSLLSELQ